PWMIGTGAASNKGAQITAFCAAQSALRRRHEHLMKVDGKHTRTIWVEADGETVGTIDQTLLPHRYATIRLDTVEDAARAIKTMQVRGAALIGATAAYGMALAMRQDASDAALERA